MVTIEFWAWCCLVFPAILLGLAFICGWWPGREVK